MTKHAETREAEIGRLWTVLALKDARIDELLAAEAPIYHTYDWLVCGWCGRNLGEDEVEAHRESHRHQLAWCAHLYPYDGKRDA